MSDKIKYIKDIIPLKIYSHITVVAAVQAIRPVYPDPKKGSRLANDFVSRYSLTKSFSPNKVAQEVGKGLHKYGSLKLDLFDEPSYVDSGESVAKAPGSSLVIGNDDYDESKKMGSYGPKCTKLNNCINDASKIEKVLNTKKFKVTKKTNLTGQKMKNALNSVKSSLKSDTSFVFYFSGHGEFEGLIGTDGDPVILDIIELVKKGIDTNSDIVIMIDACHSGIIVDKCRPVLLNRAKEYNKNNDKVKVFIDACTNLVVIKEKFHQKALELWKNMWKAADMINAGDKNGSDVYTKAYNTWPKVWNEFVDDIQTKINDTINKGKIASIKTTPLVLQKLSINANFEQDDEKKIWAQLDSIDDILNLALHKKSLNKI